MDRYAVPVVNHIRQKQITVQVPGSKSITNRALLLATLARGESTLRGVLFSDDSRNFLKCIQDLGFQTQVDEQNRIVKVTGEGGSIPKKEAGIYVGSAGTAARFLTAFLGISKGHYELDASAQMRKRPMAPLLLSLEEMGTQIEFKENQGFFPFSVISNGVTKQEISVNIEHSSQFLSALLISACCTGRDMKIQVEGTHGMAYIAMTTKMMEQFGVEVIQQENSYLIKAPQTYQSLDYIVEPDVSAACYFYAMSPLLGIDVTVENVKFDSLQGDVEFLRILERMGCSLVEKAGQITVKPPKDGKLKGLTVDMHSCSDQAITLAAIAPFADAPVTITGIGHIRFQESNRIEAICTELNRMGIETKEHEDGLTIYPGKPQPALIHTYDDHRMAMGFSLIGLRAPGIVIDDPLCCRKTFENYFQILDTVITQLTT